MATKRRKELSKKEVLKALEKGATSLTGIARHLGYRGSVGSSTTAAIRAALPDVEKRMPSSKIKTKRTVRPSGKSKSKSTGKHRRHPSNPFRESSNYALAFDCLASRPSGMRKDQWLAAYCEASGKDRKRAGYDIAVLMSAKGPSLTSERHRSCADGFVIERENDHVRLRT
jgi:hypothetical protein